ncbi:DNA polymerase III subunit gamma/tau [bacterium]|nr:DNA polymerase III subunit gamma/tau [candidate division CSSED10-310 bacterium]
MSYIVLARKWRPQTFADVVGQEHVTRTLVNAITSERIGHAFLFAGPRGVGKTTTARLLAKAVNCLNPTNAEPCNNCFACKEITAGSAIDVLEIDGASNRGIDEIRELRENAKYAPASLRYKIYIIDEVHMLTQAAFNALLKTLEEPPPHVKFILATTELHKVPVTIRSRCQRYQFRRIPVAAIADQLQIIADAEKIPVQDAAVTLMARMADGSMRDGESILDQMIAFCDGEITFELVLDLLGRLDPEIIHELGAAILEGHPEPAMTLVSRFLDQGGDVLQVLPELMQYLRDLMLIRTLGADSDMVERHERQKQHMRALVETHPLDTLALYYKIASDGERQVRYSPLPRAELDAIVLQLCGMRRLISLDKLLQRTDRIEVRIDMAPAAAPATPVMTASPPRLKPAPPTPAETKPAAAPTPDSAAPRDLFTPPAAGTTATASAGETGNGLLGSEELRDLWRAAVDELSRERPQLAAILEYAVLEQEPDGPLRVVYGPEAPQFSRAKTEERDNLLAIGTILERLLDGPVKLLVGVSRDRKQSLISQVRLQRRKEERGRLRQVMKNPLIREALDMFEGKIVKVTERREQTACACETAEDDPDSEIPTSGEEQ